jgi:predicted nucleic acid-binding protein
MPEIFLDTNILWWYFVANSKNHSQIKKYIDDLIKIPENTFVVNEFVIIEIFHLLIKKVGEKGYNLAQKLIEGKYIFFKIEFDILRVKDLKQILSYLRSYGFKTSIGGRDSSIIYSMELHSISNIVSTDKAFHQVENIEFHNPLLSSSNYDNS